MKYTDKFNKVSSATDNQDLLQISPDRVFYKIDDFTVIQDTDKINVGVSAKNLKDLWGKGLPKYLSKMSNYFSDDIPVMTIEDYLREMKNVCAGKALKTNRLSVYLNNSIRIDHVIILNKYKDHYVLMNEVYQNEKFVKALEYNFNELLQQYLKLNK